MKILNENAYLFYMGGCSFMRWNAKQLPQSGVVNLTMRRYTSAI